MEVAYSNSHHHVIAYNNVVQQMSKEKVIPDAVGQFWGEAQVVHPKFCCTGTPKITQVQYPTRQTIECKGKSHHQFNSVYYCRVQLADQRTRNMVAVNCQIIDLFDITSSQSSDAPSPPPCCKRPNNNGN